MTITVRRVRAEDGRLLKELRLNALDDSPSAFGSTFLDEADRTDHEWTLRAQRASTGVELATFFALDEARGVGLVTGHTQPEPPVEIELVSMWTSPQARRSGVGRLLVQAVIDWAYESNVPSVGLWVMRGNDPAERLYEEMGFREAAGYEPRASDPCADELRMELRLEPRHKG